MSGVSTPKNIL